MVHTPAENTNESPDNTSEDLSGATVLLVDDNDQNLELLRAYLDDLGCQTRTAADGLEAMSSIEAEVVPILDMYDMLERYLPEGCIDKEEMDTKSIMRSAWRKLVDVFWAMVIVRMYRNYCMRNCHKLYTLYMNIYDGIRW